MALVRQLPRRRTLLLASASLLLSLVSRPRGAVAAAVTGAPTARQVSMPLDDATIEWMGPQPVPPGKPASYRYKWPFNKPGFLPWTDSRIKKTAVGCAPEQVHLNYWSEPTHVAESGGRLSILLSYTTCDSTFGEDGPDGPLPTDNARTEVWIRPAGAWVWMRPAFGRYTQKVTGIAHSYENVWRTSKDKPEVKYTSPLVHHVLLKGLKPGQRVDYAIPNLPQPGISDALAGRRRLAAQPDAAQSGGRGNDGERSGQQFPAGTYYGSFTVPGGKFPFKIGAVGDSGQMNPNASVALQNLGAMQPDLVLSLGDLAYHSDVGTKDGKEEAADFIKPEHFNYTDLIGFYSPRWESLHRLYSRLYSRVPVIQTPGNHEICPEPFLESGKYANVTRFATRFKDYNAYWPSPQYADKTRDGPTLETLQPVGPTEKEDPASGMQNRNQFHAHTIPGIATIISLSNYILWESAGVAQLEFLKDELSKVDRAKTPWVIVQWHTSWYSTFSKHWRETECMRRLYEPVFRQYRVDFAFNGHNHAYERINPVYAFKPDNTGCGTMHLMLGGGCADDLTFGYIDEEATMSYLPLQPSTCPADKPGTGQVCPYTFCQDPSKFHIPAYQPPMQAATKYEKAPDCTLPNSDFPEPLCPPGGKQPAYSAYRQSTYGVGQLELLSATKARWSWYANNLNLDGPKAPTDSVIITRDPKLSCSPA